MLGDPIVIVAKSIKVLMILSKWPASYAFVVTGLIINISFTYIHKKKKKKERKEKKNDYLDKLVKQ